MPKRTKGWLNKLVAGATKALSVTKLITSVAKGIATALVDDLRPLQKFGLGLSRLNALDYTKFAMVLGLSTEELAQFQANTKLAVYRANLTLKV